MQNNFFTKRTECLSETTFYPDGTVINQCTFNKPELADGETRKSLAGRMITDDCGLSVFHPYATGGAPAFKRVMKTKHGALKEYANSFVLNVKLKKTMTQKEVLNVILDELDELALAASIFIQMLNNKKKEEKK